MSKALENAKARLAYLRQEIQRIESFITTYEEFEQRRQVAKPDESDQPQFNLNVSLPVESVDKSVRRRERRGPGPDAIAQMVERVIREVGQPMTRGHLVDALEHRDVELPAADRARYLGTIMWRHKNIFVNIEGRGYWLRGEPLAPPVSVDEVDDTL